MELTKKKYTPQNEENTSIDFIKEENAEMCLFLLFFSSRTLENDVNIYYPSTAFYLSSFIHFMYILVDFARFMRIFFSRGAISVTIRRMKVIHCFNLVHTA